MNETVYELYKCCRRLVERAKGCCNKDHSDEPLFKEWESAIAYFDKSDRGYSERYLKEKENATV